MKYLFSDLLIFDSICTILLLITGISAKKNRQIEEYLFGLVAVASSIWSFGFGMLFVQVDIEAAQFWRNFGIFGTVLYMISVQSLTCRISGIPKGLRWVLNFISLLGWPVFAMSIQPNQTSYVMSKYGMTYRFTPGIVNDLYTGYFMLVAFDILLVIIYMIFVSKLRRIRTFGKYFLLIEVLILIGTVLDMIFPAMGLPALPGSNVTQFWGTSILYYAMVRIRRNELNVSNMSEYIYRSLAVPIVVFDKEQHLHISNEAANKYLAINLEPDEYSEQKVSDFFDVDFDNEVIGERKEVTFDCVKKADNSPCNLSVSAITDKYGDVIGYIALIKDLSERMKYINELKKAREDADISNQAKSTFLANMSHEIRTPMNAIVGFSEIILKQEMDRKELLDYVTDIRDSSYGLLAIINDILDISKIESGKMELVNGEYQFKDMLQNVIVQILPLADNKGLRFDVECDSRIPGVLYGDETRVQEILINVLNNAVKYTEKGFVRLTVEMESASFQSDANIVFTVEDSGRGIKAEDKMVIFDAFEQVNKRLHEGIEGTGLGLSIVKGYVGLMNGSINVESVYGEGSVFTIGIPQKVINGTPIGEFDFKTHSFEKSNIGDLYISDTRILVVDDNFVNLKVIRKSLECYGLDVTTVDSGEKSIEICGNEDFDIVIMDQMMPGMDGIEAMRRIRELSPRYAHGGMCKIIALTANAVKGAREELLAAGFDEYVKKPIEFEHLEDVLCRFIPAEKITRVDNAHSDFIPTVNVKVDEGERENMELVIEGIDIEVGLVHCGGLMSDYLEILALAAETGREYLKSMSGKIDTDIDGYVVEIHGIKGMCYNIGASECGDKAKALEMAGREKNLDYIRANQSSFEEEYIELLDRVESALKKMTGDASDSSDSEADLSEYVARIKHAAAEYDIPTAEKILKTMMQKQWTNEEKEIIRKLEDMINDVDFDALMSFQI